MGFNTPQFSNIDLNNDGRPDLFAFDRQTARCYTFLDVARGRGAGRRWQYAPEYEWAFPGDLTSWALLRDYDCDGRADLFTGAAGGDIRVLRNVADAAGPPQLRAGQQPAAASRLLMATSATSTVGLLQPA
ncbi:MAG: VCBS repeat-containing protein [Hymenobacter sp.]